MNEVRASNFLAEGGGGEFLATPVAPATPKFNKKCAKIYNANFDTKKRKNNTKN